MKKIVVWIGLVLLLSRSYQTEESSAVQLDQPSNSIGTEENPQARADYEFMKIRNPKTGIIPKNIRQKEIEFSADLPSRHEWTSQRGESLKEEVWEAKGPFNVGGRTRAVALDIQDENTIISGGVSGGIWKSINGGTTWLRTSDPERRPSVTALAQDTRSGKENIWYFGTGELKGNSPKAVGAPYRGSGIYKSEDSGESWTLLSSTDDSEPTQFGSQFQYIWRIVTNENRTDADELLAAAYGGILRSEDGGVTWQIELGEELNNLPPETDLNESIAPFYTEIAKNDDGHFYASLSHSTSTDDVGYFDRGFYWSANGDDWFSIAPPGFDNLALSRTVISAVGTEAYFFSNKNDNTYLHRYEFTGIGMDGEPLGTWADLTDNLPDLDGISDLDVQSGYNMTIRIDPNDPDRIFLGGTNLYRSTDGFESSNNIDLIGGYEESEDVSIYENHHPDQHDVLFYTSSPNSLLSANDGGLHVTQNSSAASVSWTPLNNGYVTSQFYTIDIPKNESNEFISGGLQDNGSWMNTSPGENSVWSKILGGDGSFTASIPLGVYWYFSFQKSQIYRLSLNSNLDLTSFARVDPTIGAPQSDYLFINPYVLDPINANIMYLVGGNAIWRNNNLAQIPSGSQETTDVNWDLIDITKTDEQISALEITYDSEYLYYGNWIGGLYRLENPDATGDEVLVDISPIVVPDDAYVSCIASNPENGSELITTLSNYGVPSIFYSNDAGETFQDISGNLEEFSDGTGNGPSVRWAEIVPLEVGIRYFVATSVGLYSTENLDGQSTIWVKENMEGIGSSVVSMLDYRPLDGTFVVATHGNGVFKTTIVNFKSIVPSASEVEKFKVSHSYPNPFSDLTKIEFEIPDTQYLRVDIYDMYGKHVTNLFLGPQFAGKNIITWNGENHHGQPVEDGMYIYRIYYDGQVVGGRIVYDR